MKFISGDSQEKIMNYETYGRPVIKKLKVNNNPFALGKKDLEKILCEPNGNGFNCDACVLYFYDTTFKPVSIAVKQEGYDLYISAVKNLQSEYVVLLQPLKEKEDFIIR